MKITLTILITAMTVTATYGQITTTKVAPKIEQADNTPYDSTKNFLGKDVYKYLGDATFDSRKFAYTSLESETYHKKFGVEIFNLILKGKVKIGMTKEMCELSWGKPKSINETITSGKKSIRAILILTMVL